ncbi:MAG: SRPBCC family protein [Pseudomonadales bacterium]
MEINNPPVAKIELLIRKPVAEVFEAFVSPDTITKFWFSRSSGRLEKGKTVQWYWDLYDASSDVRVLEIDENQRIYVEWDTGSHNPTTVEWRFEPRSDTTTYVRVAHKGFSEVGDNLVEKVVDSTGGFALVLAAAKAWLEHGIELNIVADRF